MIYHLNNISSDKHLEKPQTMPLELTVFGPQLRHHIKNHIFLALSRLCKPNYSPHITNFATGWNWINIV
jgi:hypothetical protein